MNDKLLKVLDCNRKDILKLPSGAVHLWLCYFMHESENQESYLSIRTLSERTGLDKNTVTKWRDYLINNGWLVNTGATAAERYSKPSRGANKVPVVRVDDPVHGTRSSGAVQSLQDGYRSEVDLQQSCSNLPANVQHLCTDGGGIQAPSTHECMKVSDTDGGSGTIPTAGVCENFILSENVLHPNIQTKVYGYGSSSGSSSSYIPSTLQLQVQSKSDVASLSSSLRSDVKPETKPEAKPTTKPKASAFSVPVEVELRTRHNPKYDEPFPLDFNNWSVLARAEWCEDHAVGKKPKVSIPVQEIEELARPIVKVEPVQPRKVEPPSSAPPPNPVRPMVETVVKVSELAPVQGEEPAPEISHNLTGWFADWATSIAHDLHKLQAYYNPRLKPPRYWEIVWANESTPLVDLAMGDTPHFKKGWMLT